MRPVLFAVLAVLLTAAPATAQETHAEPAPAARDSVTELRLADGSVLYGRVVRESADTLVLETGGGVRVAVPLTQVERRRRVAGRLMSGRFWPADPNRTRLLFTSTGRALRRGEGYVSAYFLFFPFVGVGVTDRLTIAAGTPILPGVIGRVFYVAPKYTVLERGTASYAVGALSFGVTDEIDEGTFGIAYGVGTWGSADAAFSAGAGWGYRWGGGESEIVGSPVVMLGGERRTSRGIKLITENWLFTGDGESAALLSGGVRFLGERLSADLGLIAGVGAAEAACCYPLVNVVWTFGR